MATATRLGPRHHGRPMSFAEFTAGRYRGGYRYELIDGRLYVSGWPGVAECWVELWLLRRLWDYSEVLPEAINYVTNKPRVFVPARQEMTCPEPDLAAYRGFPLEKDWRAVQWQDVSPLIVGEIVSPDDPDKDHVRNV